MRGAVLRPGIAEDPTPDFAARAGRCRRSTCWSFEVHIVVPHHFGIRLGLVLPRPPNPDRAPTPHRCPGAVVATIWRSNPAPKSPPLSILVASISPHAARPWICALPAFAASSTATTFSEGAPGDRHAVAGAGAGRTVRPLRHRTGGHLRRAMPGHHRPARRSATPPHQRNARRRLAGHADRHHHRAGVHAPRADLAGGHRPVLRLFHVHRLRQARRPDRLRRPAAHDADHAFAAGTRPGPGHAATLGGALFYVAFSLGFSRLFWLREEQQAMSVALFATADWPRAPPSTTRPRTWTTPIAR